MKPIAEGLGYRGHPTLKRAGVPMVWSKETIAEYIKCSEDPIYFIENYVMVVNSDEGLVKFRLFDYQVEMVKSMHENRFTIINSARRAGKSSTTCGYIIWYVLFNSNKTVATLANKLDTAVEMLAKIQLAYQNLPPFLQHGIIEWHKKSFVLENGSRVFASATAKDAIRGYNVDILYLDEAAFIENWDEFYAAVYPTISSGKTTKITMCSTPCGLNHFFEIWENAVKGLNGYHPIKVTWEQVPFYDEKWKQETLAALNFDEQKFLQEYSAEFHGSSGTLIAGWKLKQLAGQPATIPVADQMNIKQYEIPQKGHQYVLVADVSEGKGLDFCAFQVIDVSAVPYKQVCSFHDNMIAPYEYAEVLNRVGRLYFDCPILVENNNIGLNVIDALWDDFEYEAIVHTHGAGRAGKKVSTSLSKGTERGIRTTSTVKSIGCAIIKLLIEQDRLQLIDKPTIYEFNTFSRKNKSFEAEEGKYDDLVMCLVLFAWLTEQDYFKELTDINTLAKLRDRDQQQMESELAPFCFVDDGIDPEDPVVTVETWPHTFRAPGHDYRPNDWS